MARDIEAVESDIEEVKAEIKDNEKHVCDAQSDVVQTETALSEVTTQLKSPSLSKEAHAFYLRKKQMLRAQLLHRRTELRYLRTKERQLRTALQQLLTELLQQELNDRLGGSTLDKLATAMMAQLRSLPRLPAPGEVLSFGPSGLLLNPKYSCVYIRSCYEPLFEVLKTSYCKDNTITGSPGAGRSCFLYYLLARLLALPEPPPYILWEHSTAPDRMWCYDHASGEVWLGNRMSFHRQLSNRKAWYISDGIPPTMVSRARITLITEPSRRVYKAMEDSGAPSLYMPLWLLEELLDCRAKVYDGVPEDVARRLYERYGGDVRYVLGIPSIRAGSGPLELEELLEPLTQALDASTTTQVRSGFAALEMGPDYILQVVHIITKDDFDLSHLDFASPWVAEEFVARAMRYDLAGLVTLVACTEGAIRGQVFKRLMHRLLAQGGAFAVAPICGNTLARTGAVEELQLPSCTSRSFEDAVEASAAGFPEDVYYKPAESGFATVDSLLRVGRTLCLFHMSVDSSKTLSASALNRLLESLGAEVEELDLRLYYVVPPDVFDDFKLSADAGSSPLGESRAARTRLYVLEGDAKALLHPPRLLPPPPQQQTGGSRRRSATTAAVMAAAAATGSAAPTSAYRPPEVRPGMRLHVRPHLPAVHVRLRAPRAAGGVSQLPGRL